MIFVSIFFEKAVILNYTLHRKLTKLLLELKQSVGIVYNIEIDFLIFYDYASKIH
jgi:hypothetical protein